MLNFFFNKDHGPLIYVVKTVLFCFMVTLPTLTIVFVSIDSNSGALHEDLLPTFAATAVTVAPLFENLVLIVVAEFCLILRLHPRSIVMVVGALSALAHWFAGEWRAVFGGVSFSVMTYSYFLWSEKSFMFRYFLTVGQHALLNTPLALAIVWALHSR